MRNVQFSAQIDGIFNHPARLQRERERKREKLEKADVCEVDKRKLQGVEQGKGHGGVEGYARLRELSERNET